MQPAEPNKGQHPVCCPLLGSAGWVLILQSSSRGHVLIINLSIKIIGKISTQPAESNRGQHTQQVAYPCSLLDSG